MASLSFLHLPSPDHQARAVSHRPNGDFTGKNLSFLRRLRRKRKEGIDREKDAKDERSERERKNERERELFKQIAPSLANPLPTADPH